MPEGVRFFPHRFRRFQILCSRVHAVVESDKPRRPRSGTDAGRLTAKLNARKNFFCGMALFYRLYMRDNDVEQEPRINSTYLPGARGHPFHLGRLTTNLATSCNPQTKRRIGALRLDAALVTRFVRRSAEEDREFRAMMPALEVQIHDAANHSRDRCRQPRFLATPSPLSQPSRTAWPERTCIFSSPTKLRTRSASSIRTRQSKSPFPCSESGITAHEVVASPDGKLAFRPDLR